MWLIQLILHCKQYEVVNQVKDNIGLTANLELEWNFYQSLHLFDLCCSDVSKHLLPGKKEIVPVDNLNCNVRTISFVQLNDVTFFIWMNCIFYNKNGCWVYIHTHMLWNGSEVTIIAVKQKSNYTRTHTRERETRMYTKLDAIHLLC